MKEITYGEDTRLKLAAGVGKLVDTVRHTLGPDAQRTLIGLEFMNPKTLDDGAMIAREVELEDATENAGAQLAKMVSEQTNKTAGDGTTTSLVLADALLKALMEEDAGFSTTATRRENLKKAEKTLTAIDEYVKSKAVPINGVDDIYRVALISSGSEAVAGIIKEAYEKLGLRAIVTQQDSKKSGISVSVSKGMSVPSGTLPLVLSSSLKDTLNNCAVLVIDGPCSSRELMADAVRAAQEHEALTVIADDFSETILDAAVVSASRGGFRVFPVKAPFYAERRSDFLQDVALFTNGKVIKDKYEDNCIGYVERCEITPSTTVLIGGKGEVEERVKEIEARITESTSEYEAVALKERIAALTSGVATINVGMQTEAEQKAVMAKIEDSIHAVKSALDGGVVRGGGTLLLEASKDASWGSFEPHSGICNAVTAPIRTLQENLGVKTEDWGSEVLDPVKVVLESLRNAWSIAKAIYLCESAVVWKKEPEGKSDSY